ncbi:hypothetical protein [Glaciihabitans sp. dw_435]|uniref:hypothetical protein n=1 Tax=Glaciihabitans sp. dw_435 TaxID=2720081 RepID=UPI001BD3C877|nr:hypothetical protein [Glaciihabitans sp. dw_435]
MATVNLSTLQDILGGTAPVNATITSQVYRGYHPAVRVDGASVIGGTPVTVTLTAGVPSTPFQLLPLPIDCYYQIDILAADGTWEYHAAAILPAGSGPFNFNQLVIVNPTTMVPIPGTSLGDALLAQIQAAVTQTGTYATTAGQAATIAVAAKNETIVATAAQGTWTGAVALTQAQSKSTYLLQKLTGNVVLTLAAGTAGLAYSCTLELQQDATGSRTLTIVNTRTGYAVPITLSTAANSVDVIRLEWNGATWSAYLGAAALAIPTAWVV